VTARLALTSASIHVRHPPTRLLFRYGVVTLTHVSLLLAMETAT
jgi:hypothetical protein